jgi:hypothetical protein
MLGPHFLRNLCLFFLLLEGLYGCGGIRIIEYYPESDGAELPDAQIGILIINNYPFESSPPDYAWVDGKQVYEQFVVHHEKVKLLPGKHTVKWTLSLVGRGTWEGNLTFNVEAGKVYKLIIDSCYYFCGGINARSFIKNATTGGIVSGPKNGLVTF